MRSKPAVLSQDFAASVAPLEPDSIYQLVMKFRTPMLGTVPLNQDIYADFVASKRPDGIDQFEVDTVNEEDGRSGFHRDASGQAFIMEYMIRGFLKAAAQVLKKKAGTVTSEMSAFKKVITTNVFVKGLDGPNDRAIMLWEPENAGDIPLDNDLFHIDPRTGRLVCVRSLRASTPQGERTALASSDAVPAGTMCVFNIEVLSDDQAPEEFLRELLAYGVNQGLGQWRNAGNGQFEINMQRIGGRGDGKANKRGRKPTIIVDEE